MKTIEPSKSRPGLPLLPVFVLLAGMITGALGLGALLGWALGLPLLASFGAGLIPMAPSTAVLFLLFGVAVAGRARTPLSGRALRFSVAAGWLGALVALPLFVLGCLNIHWDVEHLGLNITGMVVGARTGHASPVTAFCFLLASGSFLASLGPAAVRFWRGVLALGGAGVLLATSFIFLLAYGFGTPLLYGGDFIPPALNTILAFGTLGLALLALAGRPAGLFRRSPGDDSKPAFVFALIFFLLAAGIVATGAFYYRYTERHFRAEVERQLSAIAELKVSELAKWREDRRSDAAIFCKNPSFTALVRRCFEQPADTDAQRQLLDWVGKYPTLDDYDQVRLLDTQAVTRLSLPSGLKPASSNIVRVASEALRSGQIGIQDFYRHDYNQRIYLAVLVPLLDESNANRPLGVLVLRMDPAKYLYPFIRHWPTPSATAETLLLRRDGNDVLFLNDLRHQSNAALVLHVPLTRTDIPAVRAVLGEAGFMEGPDYRGVPVITIARAVPDSPWLLIAKIDRTEVYAPLRAQLWQVIILVAVLLFGAGAGVGLVWRQQRVRFLKKQVAVAEALRESQVRLKRAEEMAHIGNWEWDLKRGTLHWEDENYRIFGLPRETIPSADAFLATVHPDDLERVQRSMDDALKGKSAYDLDFRIRRPADGTERVVHASGEVTRDAEGQPVQFYGTVQDITERKLAEELIRKKDLQFRRLSANVPDMIYQFTRRPCGSYIVPIASEGIKNIFGCSPEDVLEDFAPIARVIFPEDSARVISDIEYSAKNVTEFACEFRVQIPGKPIQWILSRSTPERLSDGSITWYGFNVDITERRQAAEQGCFKKSFSFD